MWVNSGDKESEVMKLFNEDGTWKRDNASKYTAILELDKKLTENNIPHALIEIMDGWQILYFKDGMRIGDVIQHRGSYGNYQNLLEVYGFNLAEPDGWLSVDAAFKYFKEAHERG